LLDDELDVVGFVCVAELEDREYDVDDELELGADLNDELEELDDLLLELEDEDELDDLASTGIGRLHTKKAIIVSCVNLFNIQ